MIYIMDTLEAKRGGRFGYSKAIESQRSPKSTWVRIMQKESQVWLIYAFRQIMYERLQKS
jgi:hypothetical protein